MRQFRSFIAYLRRPPHLKKSSLKAGGIPSTLHAGVTYSQMENWIWNVSAKLSIGIELVYFHDLFSQLLVFMIGNILL